MNYTDAILNILEGATLVGVLFTLAFLVGLCFFVYFTLSNAMNQTRYDSREAYKLTCPACGSEDTEYLGNAEERCKDCGYIWVY